ncbi:hypothetical protein ACIHEI_36690 [Kitasatospora sp. NPDC051984]|uniref:hypothetical protein n=1 Tax=Kitasatospora sp. NPDC051984 TaxID=3364059 RepID=UPI0037C6E31A
MTTRPFPADQITAEVEGARAFAASVEGLITTYRQEGHEGTAAVALLTALHTALVEFADAPTDLAVRAEAERLSAQFVALTGQTAAQG